MLAGVRGGKGLLLLFWGRPGIVSRGKAGGTSPYHVEILPRHFLNGGTCGWDGASPIAERWHIQHRFLHSVSRTSSVLCDQSASQASKPWLALCRRAVMRRVPPLPRPPQPHPVPPSLSRSSSSNHVCLGQRRAQQPRPLCLQCLPCRTLPSLRFPRWPAAPTSLSHHATQSDLHPPGKGLSVCPGVSHGRFWSLVLYGFLGQSTMLVTTQNIFVTREVPS